MNKNLNSWSQRVPKYELAGKKNPKLPHKILCLHPYRPTLSTLPMCVNKYIDRMFLLIFTSSFSTSSLKGNAIQETHASEHFRSVLR